MAFQPTPFEKPDEGMDFPDHASFSNKTKRQSKTIKKGLINPQRMGLGHEQKKEIQNPNQRDGQPPLNSLVKRFINPCEKYPVKRDSHTRDCIIPSRGVVVDIATLV
jgi:hypothetical protein